MIVSPGKRLRILMERPQRLLVPEALVPGLARVAELMGFEALYCGGAALANFHYAIPDHGLITASELIDCARRVATATDLPLICDADQGGESVLNVHRTVREFESAGIAAIHIEDTRNPKHLHNGDKLMPIDEFAARIRVAAEARRDPDFVVIARTDAAFNGLALDEVIARGLASAEAGADMFFACTLPAKDAPSVAAALPIPLMDMHRFNGEAPSSAVRVQISAGVMVRGLFEAARKLYAELQENGRVDLTPFQTLGDHKPGSEGLIDRAIRDSDYLALARNVGEGAGPRG